MCVCVCVCMCVCACVCVLSVWSGKLWLNDKAFNQVSQFLMQKPPGRRMSLSLSGCVCLSLCLCLSWNPWRWFLRPIEDQTFPALAVFCVCSQASFGSMTRLSTRSPHSSCRTRMVYVCFPSFWRKYLSLPFSLLLFLSPSFPPRSRESL